MIAEAAAAVLIAMVRSRRSVLLSGMNALASPNASAASGGAATLGIAADQLVVDDHDEDDGDDESMVGSSSAGSPRNPRRAASIA